MTAVWMGQGTAQTYTPTRRLREGKGWSQERLAGLSGVTVECVRKLERGQVAELTFRHAYRVANALGCSVLDLVPGLAVRHAGMRGAVAQDSPKRKLVREAASARKEKMRRWLVELLRSQGGRMAQCHVMAEFRPFGLSAAWLNLRRVEAGIRTQREPGFGNRADGWTWVLPDAVSAPGRESAASGAPSPTR